MHAERPMVRVAHALLLLALMSIALIAPEAGAATPTEIFGSEDGQQQLTSTIALDMATSTGLILVSGQWESLVSHPEAWCIPETSLYEYRTRLHEPMTPVFNMPWLIWVGEMKQGIRGDWGFAYLLGWLGTVVGDQLVCTAYDAIDSSMVKTGLALVVPPILSAVGSVYGFNVHADMDLARTD